MRVKISSKVNETYFMTIAFYALLSHPLIHSILCLVWPSMTDHTKIRGSIDLISNITKTLITGSQHVCCSFTHVKLYMV